MKQPIDPTKKHFFNSANGFLLLGALLLLSLLAAIRFGSVPLGASDFWRALFHVEGYETQTVILYSVRLPRALAGLLAGVGLSLSGVLLQSITDNALASPNLIGVNAGAGFSVALLLLLLPTAFYLLPLAAFAGAFLTTLVIVLLSGKTGNSRASVILAGVAMTALLNAGISTVTMLDTDVLSSFNTFSIGGFAGIKLEQLLLPALIILLAFSISCLLAPHINLLCLGDTGAAVLGIRVTSLRLICILCASASAAAVVSFAGLLGFVGLIVPHIARKLTGAQTRPLLISAALLGGIVTVLADLVGRLIAAPSELPVGITMAFLGAPFFILLLIRKRGEF